tara:strand:- start:4926 stop:6425 length:1500 start_codon:yes stop_codon:yes gene_type:complete
MDPKSDLKRKILELVKEYTINYHTSYRPPADDRRSIWKPGDPIPYAGRVFDEDEVVAAVSSTLDFWLTLGENGSKFQAEFANFLGIKSSLLVNSGSSANLIALSTLTSARLPDLKRIKSGDEVITVAAGFPTTAAPITQVGAVPVFIDSNTVTGNGICEQLENAYSPGRTKAVMMAHALGNPFDLATTLKFCQKYDLWLIEDNCDALGSYYTMPENLANSLGFYGSSPGLPSVENSISRWTGTWGDISTQSFYPPHHFTMGEGGAVNIIKDAKLKVIAESFRDWGRDCWCPSGVDNSCKKRFEWSLGELPFGYDHKYTYSHLGYNLKPIDPQAAIGLEQLKKLPSFIEARKNNWLSLRRGLISCEHVFDFALPTHASNWDPEEGYTWDDTGCFATCSWFGFKISVKNTAPFTRTDLAKELNKHSIGNRMLFGGNLVRQPAYVQLLKDNSNSMRKVNSLEGSDSIMNNDLFIGTYPGLTKEMLDFTIDVILEFVEVKTNE